MLEHADLLALAETTDRGRWCALLPSLHIEQLPGDEPVVTVDDASRGALLGDLLAEGYHQRGALVPAARIAPLVEAVLALRAAGVPLELAFAFDELWQISRWFRPLLEVVLGAGFQQLPALTIWCVDRPLDAGWRPHRDRRDTLLGNGMPGALTVWLPLTDATPLNGCLYVLPSNLDPHYGTGEVPELALVAAQDIRALPSPAGAFLCWNHELLHWGGRASSRAAAPRISVGLEYQRADLPPFGVPLVDPLSAPPLARRLGLIGDSILRYLTMRSTPERHVELALRLLRHL